MSLVRRAVALVFAVALLVAVPATTATGAAPTKASLIVDDGHILDDKSVVCA
jgi:hypothetical protein